MGENLCVMSVVMDMLKSILLLFEFDCIYPNYCYYRHVNYLSKDLRRGRYNKIIRFKVPSGIK